MKRSSIYHLLSKGLTWRARSPQELQILSDYQLKVASSKSLREMIFAHKDHPNFRKAHNLSSLHSQHLLSKNRICVVLEKRKTDPRTELLLTSSFGTYRP